MFDLLIDECLFQNVDSSVLFNFFQLYKVLKAEQSDLCHCQSAVKEMADDREVLREIWDGKIPVCFSLASEEIFGLEQPESLYVSIISHTTFKGGSLFVENET